MSPYSDIISFKLTEEHKSVLDKMANQLGVSISEMLRRLIEDGARHRGMPVKIARSNGSG